MAFKEEITLSAFTDQVNALVAENRHLTIKNESDGNTIALLTKQYDDIASSVDKMKADYEQAIQTLRVERDQAVRKFAHINSLLSQCADIVMQALRARIGDEATERTPEQSGDIFDHPALPLNKLDEFDNDVRDIVRRLPHAAVTRS